MKIFEKLTIPTKKLICPRCHQERTFYLLDIKPEETKDGHLVFYLVCSFCTYEKAFAIPKDEVKDENV